MANDLWGTPQEVINFIENKFGRIRIDLCSDYENSVCGHRITENDNFLNDDWLENSNWEFNLNIGNLAWCNPPYSNPLPFVMQCVKWARHGYAVAGILNIDPSTKWFVELINANALIMPIIGGRIAFLNDDGIPATDNNKPQLMFYLAPFLAQKVSTEYINKSEIYK